MSNTKHAPKTLGQKKRTDVGPGRPPKERQFGAKNGNPRGHGFWKITETPRYKLEQMMKLSSPELEKVLADPKASLFEQKLAEAIKAGKWRDIKEMIDEVYGAPKEKVDVSGEIKGIEVTFGLRKKRKSK